MTQAQAEKEWRRSSRRVTGLLYRRGVEALNRVARTSYPAYKLIGQLKLRLRSLLAADPTPLLVYQMGKVGSTSVLRSLEALDLPMQIFHVHTLSTKGMAKEEQIYRSRFSIDRKIDTHLLSSFYLRRRLRPGDTDRRWRVITLVRDPVARNISSFFQILRSQHADLFGAISVDAPPDSVINRLIGEFFTHFPHEEPLRWFDDELRVAFGFDVYREEFPRERGYVIRSSDSVEILIIRVEDLDRCADEAFSDFLGTDRFELLRANEAEEKSYREAYGRVLDVIAFPDDYLDRMYSSKYATHFYSAEEIQRLRNRWTRGGTSPPDHDQA